MQQGGDRVKNEYLMAEELNEEIRNTKPINMKNPYEVPKTTKKLEEEKKVVITKEQMKDGVKNVSCDAQIRFHSIPLKRLMYLLER